MQAKVVHRSGPKRQFGPRRWTARLMNELRLASQPSLRRLAPLPPYTARVRPCPRSTMSSEMTSCERCTRTGLQVALEVQSVLLISKMDRDNHPPRPFVRRVFALAGIVGGEALAEIRSNPGVKGVWCVLASQNINAPLHDRGSRIVQDNGRDRSFNRRCFH